MSTPKVRVLLTLDPDVHHLLVTEFGGLRSRGARQERAINLMYGALLMEKRISAPGVAGEVPALVGAGLRPPSQSAGATSSGDQAVASSFAGIEDLF